MRIQEFGKAQRGSAEWEPFMATLKARMRGEALRRRFRWVAAAALLAVGVGTLFVVSRRPPQPRAALRADIPAAEAPVFTAQRGSVLSASPGVVVVAVEDRT